MNMKKLFKNFIVSVGVVLLACIILVVLFDPFFHYHRPILGLKAVLTDKEYQCIGTLKTFDYDSVIAGSSVCENYNNRWFDEKFGVKSVKAVRSYGATADLTYFLDVAYENNQIEKVFYNLDPGSFAGKPYVTFEETGCPMYLYDKNPFNDIEYVLNKDVLLEKIPYMLTKSFIGEYDEGNSFNWAQWKDFNSDMVTGIYIRQYEIEDMKPKDYYQEECDANIELITEVVEKHPETEFYFFIPPYSFVWWDNIYRCGDTDAYIYNMKRCAEQLLNYENVHVYCFIDDEEVVTNLENYMDVLHFSPDINYYIVEKLGDSSIEINETNIDKRFDSMAEFAKLAVEELIKPYEDIIKVDLPKNEP